MNLILTIQLFKTIKNNTIQHEVKEVDDFDHSNIQHHEGFTGLQHSQKTGSSTSISY